MEFALYMMLNHKYAGHDDPNSLFAQAEIPHLQNATDDRVLRTTQRKLAVAFWGRFDDFQLHLARDRDKHNRMYRINDVPIPTLQDVTNQKYCGAASTTARQTDQVATMTQL